MFEDVLELLLVSGEVDSVLVNFTPPLVTRRTDEVCEAVVRAVDKAAERAAAAPEDPSVAALPVVMSLLGAEEIGKDILWHAKFPVPAFTYPETAVRALAHALRYSEWRTKPLGTVPTLEKIDVNEARRRLPREQGEGGVDGAIVNGWLSGGAAMDVLASFGIPVMRTVEVHSAEEAGKWAEDLGAPVALKVLGPVHKSEGGGVKLNLVGHDAVVAGYEDMQSRFGDDMTGGLLQPMASPDGVETIVGALQDPAFGPLVYSGLAA